MLGLRVVTDNTDVASDILVVSLLDVVRAIALRGPRALHSLRHEPREPRSSSKSLLTAHVQTPHSKAAYVAGWMRESDFSTCHCLAARSAENLSKSSPMGL